MRLGFIGAGAVSSVLSVFFQQKGVELSGFYSRSKKNAQTCAERTGAKVFNQLQELMDQSDWICIAVNDDQIYTLARTIGNQSVALNEKTFFHTSGVHASDVLDALKEKGARVFSLHPLQAFSKFEVALSQVPKTHFSLEGMVDDDVEEWLKGMALNYFKIDASQKTRYHLAAVIVSNYLVSTLAFGLDQMNQIGLSDAHALNAFWPLIEGTINNIKNVGVKNALTGPIVRGDVQTIEKHLSVLKSDEERILYQSLGLQALSIARERGIDAGAYDCLLNLLNRRP